MPMNSLISAAIFKSRPKTTLLIQVLNSTWFFLPKPEATALHLDAYISKNNCKLRLTESSSGQILETELITFKYIPQHLNTLL